MQSAEGEDTNHTNTRKITRMKEGTIEILRDDKSPYQSPNTRLVSAARAVNFQWGNNAPFMDSFEEKEDGEIKRNVSWCMDGDQRVEFLWVTRDEDGNLVANEEKVNFATFRKRYIDLEWCRENPDHPIAYLRGAHYHHARMLKAIHELPRHQVIRNGNRRVSIPTNLPEDKRKKLLSYLK